MNSFKRHIRFLLLIAGIALLCTSCLKDFLDRNDTECEYTAQIRYDYNRENTSDVNLLTTYVGDLEEYIFDERGILLLINPVAQDICDGTWHSDLDLPPGKYSLITVGNRTSMSAITDNGRVPQIGVTHRDNFLLTLENESPAASGRGYYDNCGRLFHTYRTFSIEPGKSSFIRADMVHSHCVIRFTIRWRGTPPANAGLYYVQMKDVPSEYNLMPEFYYPKPLEAWDIHNPQMSDHYETSSNAVIHHIPQVHNDRNIVTHRKEVRRVLNDVQGETVTYRLREAGQTMFSVHTAAGDRVMKDIHINDFLNRMEVDLDHTLRQEYEIIFEILEDGRVHVFFPQVGDWDEGDWIY